VQQSFCDAAGTGAAGSTSVHRRNLYLLRPIAP
jgi:hypothetical protein